MMTYKPSVLLMTIFATCLCASTAYAKPKAESTPTTQPQPEEKEADRLPDLTGADLHISDSDTHAEKQRKILLYKEVMGRVARANDVDFDIAGTVVDEDGKPMKDVKMRYGFSSPTGLVSDKRRGEGREVVIDGSFSFQGKGYQSAGAFFKKEGYYDEHIAFDGPKDFGERSRDAIKGIFTKRPVVVKHDIKVVMVKQGKMTHTTRYCMWIDYTTNDSATIIDFSKLAEYSSTPIDKLSKTDLSAKHAVYVTAQTGPDGLIKGATGTITSNAFSGLGKTTRIPEKTRLVMTNPEDGFVPITLKPVEGGSRIWNRQMKQAPEKGYQRELVLDTETIRQMPFFYFKMDGKYGKGRILDFDGSKDGKSFSCRVDLHIQEDGTRNLETAEWGL